VTKWQIPGGGSPDMGNVTADGTQPWLSGRNARAVYVLSTADGHLIRKIGAGNRPHRLCVWPQPGRYSPGHTGISRADDAGHGLGPQISVRLASAHLSEAPTARCISVSVRPSYRGHLHATP
jgi:hypothetical protein